MQNYCFSTVASLGVSLAKGEEKMVGKRVILAEYPGKLFPGRLVNATYSAFYEYGIGAMRWSWNGIGNRRLHLLVPYMGNGPDCMQALLLYMNHQEGNWAKEGIIVGWDGNEEKPTLQPSIHIPGGWHGWVKEGNLITSKECISTSSNE